MNTSTDISTMKANTQHRFTPQIVQAVGILLLTVLLIIFMP